MSNETLAPKKSKWSMNIFVRPVKNRLKEIFIKGLPQLKNSRRNTKTRQRALDKEAIDAFIRNVIQKLSVDAEWNIKKVRSKKSNQFLFDYSVIDDIKKDAKTMAKKEILGKV